MSAPTHHKIIGADGGESVWPAPSRAVEVEWQLRYGDAESVRLAAASIVSAYIDLTMRTTAGRTLEVRRLIREAEASTSACSKETPS